MTGETVGKFSKQGASLWQSVCMELGKSRLGGYWLQARNGAKLTQGSQASAEDWTTLMTMPNA